MRVFHLKHKGKYDMKMKKKTGFDWNCLLFIFEFVGVDPS